MGDVVLMGSKGIGASAATWLATQLPSPHRLSGVVTIDDRDDARSRHDAIVRCASAHGIPLVVGDSRDVVREALDGMAPDVVIVAGWYRILDVATHPDALFVGFHGSLLPRYRGNAPVVWQIINGEPDIALSMFELTPGMDEGRIVAQATRPFGEHETIADALRWVEATSTAMLTQHCVSLLDGSAVLSEQAPTGASYCGRRRPEDGRIDWSWPARRIHDFVRAQTRPYPGAFTALADQRRVTVWAAAVDDRTWYGVPGTIVERRGGSVVVTCGSGAVVVTEVEVDDVDPATLPAVALEGSRLG